MATNTATQTTTITAGDVRRVMVLTTEEITTICTAAQRAARDFNVDSALVDCSMMVLNEVINAIRLQIYADDELVREYAYQIAEEPLQEEGPPPAQPPLGPVPDGARLRLVVTPNPRVPKEVRDGWFQRLGWTGARPLREPENASRQRYGTFVSGGFGVEREVLSNPKYDRPLAADHDLQKED